MADSNHANPPPSHPNPFGYNILPPESDLSHTRGQPILEDSLQTDLNHFFDSPDHNTAAILQNPAVTSYINSAEFDLNFDSNSSWNYDQHTFTSEITNPFLQSYVTPLRQSHDNANVSHLPHYDGDSNSHRRSTTIPAQQPPPQDLLSGFGLEEDAPDDVVKAATKLFEYRSQKQAISQSRPQDLPPNTPASASSFHARLPSHDSRPSHPFSLPMAAPSQEYASSRYQPPNSHYRNSVDSNAAYSPPPNNMPYVGQRSSSYQPYHFGSDSNFAPDGYSGPQRSTEQNNMDFINTIARFQGESGAPSAASSHPQSPILTRQEASQYQSHSSYPYPPVKQEGNHEPYDHANSNKRRRMMANAANANNQDARYAAYAEAEPSVDDRSSAGENDASPAVKSQSSQDPADEDIPVNPRKRRKSSPTSNAKANAAARKNLTEEQKRENHIKSEQKRRNIIKDGYKNLNDLVPNLKQGGFSKSATLTETVRELETLQAANLILSRRLREKELSKKQ